MELLTGAPDLTIIDQIPWIELDHAYGAAFDIPEQLRALLNPDSDIRQRAYYGFYGNLFHQGSVYSATVASIPVFQDLLQYNQVPDRSLILELLASFAIGFAESQFANISLAEFIGNSADELGMDVEEDGDANNVDSDLDDDESTDELDTFSNDSFEFDDIRRDCYLAVGAGVPLYELLLDDTDPQVAISAAFILAFFPAHAFESCRVLLRIASDPSQHPLRISSALIAISYLGGGPVREEYLHVLRNLIAEVDDDHQISILPATAVYCILREKQEIGDETLVATCEGLAIRCVEQDVPLPECSFYRTHKIHDSDNLSPLDVNELMLPKPKFPWHSLSRRIVHHASYRRQSVPVAPTVHRGPDPDSFTVKPGVFDQENVTAAVRRLHAHKWRFRTQGPDPVKEFAPFVPHAMLAWEEVLRLLDSEIDHDRWAAADVLEHFPLLNEDAIRQLIERLHREDNGKLSRLIQKHAVSHMQCQLLCDRLCSGDFVRSETSGPREAYLSIVIQQGTVDQIRQLFEKGEFKEKARAALALAQRDEIDPIQALPVYAESLASNDFGLKMSVTYLFCHTEAVQNCFLESYVSLSPVHKWAVANALASFQADLTIQRDALFTCIETEENPVLMSKLIEVISHLPAPQPSDVERLMKIGLSQTPAVIRCTVVQTLGHWIGKTRDNLLNEKLQAFFGDPSPRVRRAATDELIKFRDPDKQSLVFLRRLLVDTDPGNRRHAMWHLSCMGELTVESAAEMLSPDQSDRNVTEALLAFSLNRNRRLLPETVGFDGKSNLGPLTRSVYGWISK